MSVASIVKRVLANDVFVRAERTFVQAFIAQALAVQGTTGKTVTVSAVAAGISAVWNGVVRPWIDARKAAK
jgi:capsid protein